MSRICDGSFIIRKGLLMARFSPTTTSLSCHRLMATSRTSPLLTVNQRFSKPTRLRIRQPRETSSRRLYKLGRSFSDSSTPTDCPSALARELTKLSEQNIGFEGLSQALPTHTRTQIAAATQRVHATVETIIVPEPTTRELRAVMITTGIPFIAFGFMDNAILIIAGDAIDTSLGVLLGISTMCAAALGNIVSDVAGVMTGTIVEDFCSKYMHLQSPDLTSAQRKLRSVRYAGQFGTAIGMIVGCVIGMFPLLLIDSHKVQAKKREKHLDDMFRDVITEAGSLIGAQRTCLFMVVQKDDAEGTSSDSPRPNPDGKYLYAKYDALNANRSTQTDRFIPLGRGIVSRAALTGEAWNIYDVRTEPDFTPETGGHDSNEELTKEFQIRNMLCVPVLDANGRAIAVIQAINKVGQGTAESKLRIKPSTRPQGGFTPNDVQILKALASHITVSLQRMNSGEADEDMRLRDAITTLKEHGLMTHPKDNKTRSLFPEDD